jgi:opacity protein-like surface antigen
MAMVSIAHAGDFWDTISSGIEDRLELGTRVSYYMFVDDSTDIGSIDTIEEEQDLAPFDLFLRYKVSEYWGFEITRDAIAGESQNSNQGGSDGVFELDGPIISVFGRYPNESRYTPYFGAGIALFSGDFDAEDWWALGYEREDYYNKGQPDRPLNGIRTRVMDVDDTTGLALYAGCDTRLWENVFVDFVVRYVNADTEATFSTLLGGKPAYGSPKGPYDLDMSYLSLNIGAKYVF